MTTTTEDKIGRLCKFVLSVAKRCGATDCDVVVRVADAVTTNVRMGAVESLKSVVQSRYVSLRVFVGDKCASVSTTEFNRRLLAATISDAVELARESEPDPDSGLAEAAHLARLGSCPDLKLYDPQVSAVDSKRKIELALAAEAAALGFDQRITNSSGAGFKDQSYVFGYASSRGFLGVDTRSYCSLSASVVAGEGSGMKTGSWWHQSCSFNGLASPEEIGHEAARRAIRSLGARKVDSQKCPVVFDPQMASDLLSKLRDAAEGSAIYRKNSFLVDRLGKPIASKLLTIVDDPFIPGGLNSGYWGTGGLRREKRIIVDQGQLVQYFIGTYDARRLKTVPNGGSGSNLFVQPGESTPEQIIGSVNNGLYLTGISGFGFNQTTGDYSLGASGLWIVDGELAFPVDEITVASTLDEMLQGIEAVGNDLSMRSAASSPTLLINSMTIGGK